MKYFPLLLFLPAAIVAWAAFVAESKNDGKKLKPSEAVLAFLLGVVFLLPISVWGDFFGWLAHKVFNSN
jgi:hypothetical protein